MSSFAVIDFWKWSLSLLDIKSKRWPTQCSEKLNEREDQRKNECNDTLPFNLPCVNIKLLKRLIPMKFNGGKTLFIPRLQQNCQKIAFLETNRTVLKWLSTTTKATQRLMKIMSTTFFCLAKTLSSEIVTIQQYNAHSTLSQPLI